MTDQTEHPDHPQIYLITPGAFELSTYPDQLSRCLDSTEVACLRLSLTTKDEDEIARAADALRPIAHERDIALVIDSHMLLVERLGLDGVHLTDGARSVKKLRKELGEDAIIGSYCHNSRHDGMNAGELGADYVSFGPAGISPLGDGRQAEQDLFEWWSMMIEVPVVAEGHLNAELIKALAPHTDFFGLGDEIWLAEDPAKTLGTFAKIMGQGR